MVKHMLLPATCLLSLSGCSLALVEGPPEPAAGQQATGSVSCTDSMILPVLDFVGGAGFLAYGISALWLGDAAEGFEDAFDLEGDETVSDEVNLLGYAFLAGAGGLAYSGIQGRSKVNSCRGVRAAASDAALLFLSRHEQRVPAFMKQSVWHDVLNQYRSQQNDPLLPSARQ